MKIKELVKNKIATFPQIGEWIEVTPDGSKAPVKAYILGGSNRYGDSNLCVIQDDLETFYHNGFNKLYKLTLHDIENIDYCVDWHALKCF